MMETMTHHAQMVEEPSSFVGRTGSSDLVSAAFKKPVFRLRRKSSSLGMLSEDGTRPDTTFDASPLSWHVLEKDTETEVILLFTTQGIQIIYDNDEDNATHIDWGCALSAEATKDTQTFSFVIRQTTKKTCLDTFTHKYYFTPKYEIIRKAFYDFLSYYTTH